MGKISDLLFPKENKFFFLLKFYKVINNNISNNELLKQLKEIERKGDKFTHEIIEMLNKTLITPIDREDIYQLTVLLDDILDILEEIATLLHIYNIEKPDEGILNLTDISFECIKEVDKAIMHLNNFGDIRKHIIHIHTIEKRGDKEYIKCLSQLFKTNTNIMDVIKLKDIYDHLESLIDKCKNVANVIDNIVVKHA